MTLSDLATNATESRAAAHAVSLRIPARPELVGLCRLALTGFGRVHAIGADELADLKLALTEAVANAVRHAYTGGRGGTVDVTFDVRDGRVVVEVGDDGDGFDPQDVPVFDGVELSEGGLGLAIIETIADALEIDSAPGRRGTRLRFVKTI